MSDERKDEGTPESPSSNVSRGTDYELFVRDIMRRLIEAQKLGITVNVEHDKALIGRNGQEHQVDVYWEYRIGGITHKVAIDCKGWNQNVKKMQVLVMIGLMQDVPGVQGVIVTSKNFQSGAVEAARNNNVGLKVIRQAEESDYKGRLKTIVMHINITTTFIKGAHIQLDKEWYENNKTAEIESATGSIGVWSDRALIHDLETDRQFTILDMLNAREPRADEQDGIDYNIVKEWRNAFLNLPDRPPLKIAAIKIVYGINSSTNQISIGRQAGEILVKDAISGTLLFIDERGVTGDTKEEFGSDQEAL